MQVRSFDQLQSYIRRRRLVGWLHLPGIFMLLWFAPSALLALYEYRFGPVLEQPVLELIRLQFWFIAGAALFTNMSNAFITEIRLRSWAHGTRDEPEQVQLQKFVNELAASWGYRPPTVIIDRRPLTQEILGCSPAIELSAFRAFMLVPESLVRRFHPHEMRIIFAHEFEHVRYHDPGYLQLTNFASSIAKFNAFALCMLALLSLSLKAEPTAKNYLAVFCLISAQLWLVIHILTTLSRRAQSRSIEYACDAGAIRNLGWHERVAYFSILLAVESSITKVSAATSLSFKRRNRLLWTHPATKARARALGIEFSVSGTDVQALDCTEILPRQ